MHTPPHRESLKNGHPAQKILMTLASYMDDPYEMSLYENIYIYIHVCSWSPHIDNSYGMGIPQENPDHAYRIFT